MSGKVTIGIPTWDEKRKTWRCSATNADGKRRSFYSSDPRLKGRSESRKKAQAWIDAWDDPDQIRFGKAWEQYLEYYSRKNRQTSANVCEARGKAHLVPVFKNRVVSSISKREWQAVVDNAYDDGAKSIKTLKGITTVIRSFCRWAASKSYLRDDAVPQYFDYPIGAGVKKKKILQPDQLGVLFSPEEEEASWYMPMWRFLTLTGLRRGELCALQRVRDYNPNTFMLTVRESISHEGIVTDGKTINAERTIYLAPLAQSQLQAHRKAQIEAGIRPEETRYLFTDPNGRRLSPRALLNYWQKWREAHGIDLTLHELRHTFISYSRLKSDISLEELKVLYGHSKTMDTDRTYVHEIEKSPEEIRAEQEKTKREAVIIDSAFLSLIKESIDKI